jgi:hypothetical protein
MADGQRFELWDLAVSGFQSQRTRPLCEPSMAEDRGLEPLQPCDWTAFEAVAIPLRQSSLVSIVHLRPIYRAPPVPEVSVVILTGGRIWEPVGRLVPDEINVLPARCP